MRPLARQNRDDAPFSAVDPRVRLAAALLLLALVVSSGSVFFPLLVMFLCLTASLSCGMPVKTVLLRMLHPLLLALSILLLKTFVLSGATGTAWLQIRTGGPVQGALIASRIIGAASVVILLSRSLTFTDTMAALAWLRVPRGLIEVSLFAWRAIFVLYDDAATVYTAQKNRLGYCDLKRGLSSFGTMAGMLTIRAFDNSHAMTVAMSQRGYDGNLPLLRGTRPHSTQLAGLLFFALLATAAWAFQY